MIQIQFHYAFSLSSSECQIQVIFSIPICHASCLAPVTRYVLASNAVLNLILPTLPFISSRTSSCPICKLPALSIRSCCSNWTRFPNCAITSKMSQWWMYSKFQNNLSLKNVLQSTFQSLCFDSLMNHMSHLPLQSAHTVVSYGNHKLF